MSRSDVGVLARGHRFGFGIRGKAQEVGLDALGAGVAARVRVNRQEQVGVLAVGDGRALFERDERVRSARQHDLDAGLLLQKPLQAQRDVERHGRFDWRPIPACLDRGRRARDR